MLKGLLSGLTTKTALMSIILVSNAFVWYYCADDILVGMSTALSVGYFARLQIWTTDFAVLIASAFVGAYLSNRLGSKSRFLSVWMTLGVLLPFASLLINPADVLSVTLLGFGFSLSLGIGLPSCMGYFTNNNAVETRGRLGGLIMLFTGVSVVVLQTFLAGNLFTLTIALAVWRGFGLLSFVLLKPSEICKTEGKTPTYKSIVRDRPFILYFVPWIMFSLANYLATPVADMVFNQSMITSLLIIENGISGVSAVIGGFLADTVGRKRMAIAGFVALGLGYAVLGVSPASSLSWYFHTVVDGIAWGILIVIFVTTLWGDLSHGAPSEKFYAMGVFPFFISRFLPLVLGDQIKLIIPGNTYAVFSFTAFFLFLAVLPLIYAPETLPEKMMKDRELRNYLEKAQEIAAKAQKKEEAPTQKEDKDTQLGFEVEQEDFEKAKKLAEKYY